MSGRYDAVVVGAGSVGVPAAMELAEAGLRTLVLDGRASAGQGANKAAIGGVRATHSDQGKIAVCQRSIEVFSSWQERHGDDIEWRRGGYTFVAYRPQEEATLKGLLAVQHGFGLDIRWLEREALLERVPALNPDGLIGGTHSPGDGSASPMLSLLAFHRRARELGAEFRFNEPVTGIDVKKGRVEAVRTAKGTYRTACVIDAAGALGSEVARMAGVEVPVRPDSHEGGITEPVARFLEPMVVDIRPAPGSANFYFYQSATGQVVFCITPHPPILGEDTRETSSFLPMVARRLVEVVPRLANLRVRRTWRGLYPMTPDGLPIIGNAPTVEGLVLAVGMCGQGFMLGPGLAHYLARMVKGKLSAEDREVLAGFSPGRAFAGEERLK